jgi:glycosyltransferase involved in cell wall biosynthesis
MANLAHLAVACHWAARNRREPVDHVHAQWAHSAASIAAHAARLLGTSFSFTGHAADLFRERVALADKVRQADFIACISTFHRDFYRTLGARDDQLELVYCGIDVEHFRPRTDADEAARAGRPFHVLSAARLVPKKGLDDLVEACRILTARGLDLRCTIAGSGPLEAELRAQVERAGLADRVTLTGRALKQEDIPAFMHSGDAYCLPCVRAADGDVDGLPQMLMEAMACGLPVVSTRLVGIPDLVVDGRTGLLVEPDAPEALADALERLARDPDLRRSLAAEGRRFVLERFEIATALRPLLDQYRRRLRHAPATAAAAPPPTPAASRP